MVWPHIEPVYCFTCGIFSQGSAAVLASTHDLVHSNGLWSFVSKESHLAIVVTRTKSLSLRNEPQEPLEPPLASHTVESHGHNIRVTSLGVVIGSISADAFVKWTIRCRNESWSSNEEGNRDSAHRVMSVTLCEHR
jgi:hypothetical protein